MKLETVSEKRRYRQSARAELAEATGRRILDAFMAAIGEAWVEDITLDQVARAAGVTVQTVIRRFGGKEGLLEAVGKRLGDDITGRRSVPVGDFDRAVSNLCDDYEVSGDLIARLLAQEARFAALKPLLDFGRQRHRAWVASVAAPWLDRLGPPRRQAALDALVAAMDVYVWKLARRDMGRSRAETARLILRLARGALESIRSESPSGDATP